MKKLIKLLGETKEMSYEEVQKHYGGYIHHLATSIIRKLRQNNKFDTYYLDIEDIKQDLRIKLYYVYEHYDISKGYTFSTYAFNFLKYVSMNLVKNNLRCQKYNREQISLDKESMEFEKSNFLNLLNSKDDIEKEVFDKLTIKKLLKQLRPEERLVLYLYFYEDLTDKDVARKLNITQQCANKRKQIALKKCFFNYYGIKVKDVYRDKKEDYEVPKDII